MVNLYSLVVMLVLLPLVAAVLVGFMPRKFPRSLASQLTTLAVGISFFLSLIIAKRIFFDGLPPQQISFYTWAVSGSFQFNLGFLIDQLSALMLVVVTFVSFLVHIYSMGYMQDDPGYTRFFCYISFFTFAMLVLVSGNNFLQLYFGWEGVGLASYLLIGFWFKKDSANAGGLKAFLVNRVGDLGFLLGIAAILNYFGTLEYRYVFAAAPELVNATIQITPYLHWSIITVICILLFVGAMGKSAQMPLHVWLPDSMEGPTPISALIHAATMVTAGVYMISRMSPLFEYSTTALSVVLIIGATSALFTGFLALVQNDIKRVIAYSTLSQLGYMIAALGASAYAAGMFHLITHACFKALLFLTAGSVIIALHHEQNIQKMGNLRRYLPITFVSFLIGALALSAVPPFSGFYSKDAIIQAVRFAQVPGANYAYFCLLVGVFVTALYTFRLFFLVFYTNERVEPRVPRPIHEPRWTMWAPSIVLAIPSVFLGFLLYEPMLKPNGLLGQTVKVLPSHQHLETGLNAWIQLANFWQQPSVWLGLGGILVAWLTVVKYPAIRHYFTQRFSLIYRILLSKYGFDSFNQLVFVKGGRRLAGVLFNVMDMKWLDGYIVNGSGRLVTDFSRKLRRLQSGYLYHYAFAMILGVLAFLVWFLYL